jgi:hypothetical protein
VTSRLGTGISKGFFYGETGLDQDYRQSSRMHGGRLVGKEQVVMEEVYKKQSFKGSLIQDF